MHTALKYWLIAILFFYALVAYYMYSCTEWHLPKYTSVLKQYATYVNKTLDRKSTTWFQSFGDQNDDYVDNLAGNITQLDSLNSAIFQIDTDDVYRHIPHRNTTLTTITGWDINVFKLLDKHKATFMVIKPITADPYKHLIAPFSYQWIGSKQLCDFFLQDRKFPGKRWTNAKRSYRLHNYYNSTCVANAQHGLHETTLWPKFFRLATQAVQELEDTVELIPDITHHHPNMTTFLIVMRNAWCSVNGHTVIWETLRYAEVGCFNTNDMQKHDYRKPKRAFERVFVIAQGFQGAVFHSINEGLSRLIPYLPFLRARPDIAIVSAHNPLIDGVLQLLGISSDRIVRGPVFARTLYMPEGTPCVQVLPIQTQLFYQHIQEAIQKKIRHTERNLVILITRKEESPRHFNNTDAVRSRVREEVEKAGLEFWEFGDDPLPDFETTIKHFSRAAMVVGGHGAGMANMLFVPPGGFIIEVLCDGLVINMCFQRLASIVGHRYYGLLSQKGCLDMLTPDVDELGEAVRTYLNIITKTKRENLWPKWVGTKRLGWQTQIHGNPNFIREFITSDEVLYDNLQTRTIYQGWTKADMKTELRKKSYH